MLASARCGRAAVAALLLLGSGAASALGANIPSPESHFGHAMGADRRLLDWSQVVSYFDKLASASDRIKVVELGKTTEGRPYIAAFFSAPDTLQHLERYREIQAKLADPRTLTAGDATSLITQGKTVVLITCSIHSTEVASTSTAVEFAYRLLASDKPRFQQILQNTIFILVPSQNPDGVDLVTRWYRSTLGTPFEGTNPPELYQKYVGHDNNRDWYIFSQAETRLAVSKLHNVWHPQIVYDVHQQGAYASRIFVPPWLDPIDPNIDPAIASLCNQIGSGMAADLTAAGRSGVVIHALYDFWSAARHYQAYHGGLRILSESASARLATPIHVRPEEIRPTAPGYNPRERSWNYLQPWLGGDWSQRDIVEDQLIAIESCLYQAALRREDLLRSFYQIGKRASERKDPVAFVVPARQFDPGATAKLLETLQFGQVEIDRAPEPFTADGKDYEAGSYVIRMQQPYSSYAKTLLERQIYPDLREYPGGPPRRPYDVTAQTLPLLMGVAVDTISKNLTARLSRVEDFQTRETQSLEGSNVLAWKAVNRAWAAGSAVWRNPANGDFSLQAKDGWKRLNRPRIGLYKSWVPVMDEGWTRWLFENFGFAYTSLRNRDIRSDNLRERFDVIVFPDQPGDSALGASALIHSGYRTGTMPEEYTGGIGDAGAESLKKFVAQGGTLVFLNDSCLYAIEHLGVAVRNAVQGLPSREYYSPGSLLNTRLEQHPLTLGLPRTVAIWSENSPAFDIAPNVRPVAIYPASGILASGWLLGEKHIANKSALVDVSMGTGHVLLFGLRPQYRAQSYQMFKVFFNALLPIE